MSLSVARGSRLPGEAWSRRDWALAQAAKVLDRSRCPGCGTPLWLAYDKGLKNKWEAPLPKRCHPCTAKGKRMKDYDDPAVIQPHALHFRVEQKN